MKRGSGSGRSLSPPPQSPKSRNERAATAGNSSPKRKSHDANATTAVVPLSPRRARPATVTGATEARDDNSVRVSDL
jgi:hypothetical protein